MKEIFAQTKSYCYKIQHCFSKVKNKNITKKTDIRDANTEFYRVAYFYPSLCPKASFVLCHHEKKETRPISTFSTSFTCDLHVFSIEFVSPSNEYFTWIFFIPFISRSLFTFYFLSSNNIFKIFYLDLFICF